MLSDAKIRCGVRYSSGIEKRKEKSVWEVKGGAGVGKGEKKTGSLVSELNQNGISRLKETGK